MEKTVFYFKMMLPNVIFLGAYLFFLFNRELFSNAANTFSWIGYSFSVLVLVSISVYLNRAHRVRIRFEDQGECLDKLRRMFYKNGYRRKCGRSNCLFYNKYLVCSSFFTPGLTIYIRKDHVLVEGPKVKVDDVVDWFDEQDCTAEIPFEQASCPRKAS